MRAGRGRPAGLLALLLALPPAGSLAGQEADEPERPPAKPPADAFDVLSLPLRVAMLPLTVVGRGLQGLAAVTFGAGGRNPVAVAIGDMRAWGVSPRLATVGPRSGPGAGLALERYEPFFVETEVSIRGSQRHRAGVRAGRKDGPGVRAVAEFRRYAEPHFWGVGPDTEPAAASDFRWDRVDLEAVGLLRSGPVSWRGELGWEANEVAPGSDDGVPDLVDGPAADEPFGLRETTRFARFGAGLTLDATRVLGYQRRGFRADLGGTAFVGVGGTDADFLRWTGELVGYLPLNPRQELALRGLLDMNRPRGGRGVPFTHLASLGGSATVRGFERDRFRDLDMVALQSEWRYEIWRSIHDDIRQEGFLFFDAGTVAERIDRIEGSHLRSSYGFGMRTVDERGVALLWYLAFGGEATRFRVKLSWPF